MSENTAGGLVEELRALLHDPYEKPIKVGVGTREHMHCEPVCAFPDCDYYFPPNKFVVERLRDILDAHASRTAEAEPINLVRLLTDQMAWSTVTFGPGRRTVGVLSHIRKELQEIEENPTDCSEWIDVVILAFDGAWRSGHTPEEVAAALVAKYAKNRARTWPDWRTASEDEPIEHVKGGSAAGPERRTEPETYAGSPGEAADRKALAERRAEPDERDELVTQERRDGLVNEARAEVKAAVEEWFSNVSLDDLFRTKGWS